MKAFPKILLTSATEMDLTGLVDRIVDQVTGLEAAGIKAAGFQRVERPGKKGKSEVIIRNLNGSEVLVGVQGKGRGKRIGKFLVDVDTMEEATLEAIGFQSGVDLYVIQEIGPWETMSRTFSVTAKMLLKKDAVAVLAVVAKQGRGFVREVKRLPGIDYIEVSPETEPSIEEKILKDLLTAFAMRAREQQPTQ